MKLSGILLIVTIFYSQVLMGQIIETEPNGTVLQSGTQTISTLAELGGSVCLGAGCVTSDPTDFWIIADGSSGSLLARWTSDVTITLREYSTSARNTAPISVSTLSSGTAVTISGSSFYSISMLPNTLNNVVNYTVNLGNNPPTATDFFINDSYEGLAYTFTTSQFGYSDADGDPLSLIRITSVPGFTAVFVDANNDNTFEIDERVGVGETVSKADIDAGNFKLFSLVDGSKNITFEVFDGIDYSVTDYIIAVNSIPIPSVTLSIDDASDDEQTLSSNVVTATLSNEYGENTTVDLSFAGTATNLTDYTRSADAIIIPAGSTTGTISLNNVDDAVPEDDETVIVDISSVTNGEESGTQQITYTIVDDDFSELSIDASGFFAFEDNIDGKFIISTSAQFPMATNVTFTVGGTAISGVDYSALGTSFTFPANTNSVTITVPVIADNLVEPDETVNVTLTGTDNTAVIIGAMDKATLTIFDNDFAELSIAATTDAAEDGTDGLFTISTTKEFSKPVTVNIISTGTATSGDYNDLGSSFVFPANTLTTTLPIEVLADNLVEPDETVTVTMTGTNNPKVTIGSTDDATITITDNDVAELSIAATTQAAEDATDGLFTISTTNQFSTAVTIDITVGGSATQGTDYASIGTQVVFPANQNTLTIPVDVTADNILEGDQTVIVTMTGTNNTDVSVGATDQATITITDNDVATLSIVATTQAAEDVTNGIFTISTSNQFTTATNVTFTVGGTATSGVDYSALGTSFTFPANANSIAITVPVIADNLVELNETVIVTLTGTDNAAVIIGAMDEATVTILDNDDAELSIVATTDAAEDGTNGLFTISTTEEFSKPVTVNIISTGTATSGDYNDLGSSFVFPANTLTTTLPIEVLADNLVEPDETVTVTMIGTNNPSVTIGSKDDATLTITDNDGAELSIAATTQAAEDATDGLFTISTTNQFSTAVTIDITVGGSATQGLDYASIGTSVIFPANQNTLTIPVDVTADNITEGDQTVIVTMTGTNNADVTVGATDEATVTITDNDQAVLSIAATTQAAEDVTNGLFTISTSNQFTTATNVTFTVDGTATSGVDYSALGTSFTFPANTNSITITVPVIADNIDEADENVIVTLTATDNLGVVIGATDEATITITDDDESPVITPLQQFAIDEDATNMAIVGTVIATDTDAGTTFNNWIINSGNTEGIFSINPNSGQLSIVDNTNLDRESTASYTLSISVSDGTNTSATADVVVNVNDVNDNVPIITAAQGFTVTEGIDNGTAIGTVVATDADVTPTIFQSWAIISGNTSIDGDGELPFLIDPISGQLSINDTGDLNSTMAIFSLAIAVSDGVNTSSSEIVTITVNAVNDAPSFIVGMDQDVLEDAGLQTIPNWASGISAGPADEAGQILTFNVVSDNPTLFDLQPEVSVDGTLLFTPAPDEFGSTIITISISDDGGTANGGVDVSQDQTFTITINPVNDAPAFTSGDDQEVFPGVATYTVNNWASGITPGPANESGQVLTFDVTNDNNVLFTTQPAINANGDLIYTVAPFKRGRANITVQLLDDGGVANNGDDRSDVIHFTITIWKLPQRITFKPIGEKRVGQAPFDLEATGGDSGSPVQFSIATEPANGVATLQNNTIILGNNAGRVIVTATQEGSNTFEAAPSIDQIFNVVANEAFLPTLFTPNEDGKNDRFIIRGGGSIANIKFSILDRQGNVLYESTDWDELSNQGWDGYSNGKRQTAGSYIWIVKGSTKSGEPFLINGKQTGVIKLSR